MSALRFSAVVLAAGTSTRMGGRHKLLLPLGEEPVIRRSVRAVLGAQPAETVVVTGYKAAEVIAALTGQAVRFQHNPRFVEGQMTSVAAGVGALAVAVDAVMVCLGDMALLDSADYLALIAAFAARTHGSILVPQRDGQRGNPVVFAARHLEQVVAGERNLGCRRLIADHPEEVCAYEAADERYFADLDTPEDYARVLARIGLDSGAALIDA